MEGRGTRDQEVLTWWVLFSRGFMCSDLCILNTESLLVLLGLCGDSSVVIPLCRSSFCTWPVWVTHAILVSVAGFLAAHSTWTFILTELPPCSAEHMNKNSTAPGCLRPLHGPPLAPREATPRVLADPQGTTLIIRYQPILLGVDSQISQ